MRKLMTLSGHATNADDPQRAVWYGQCGYWTDDWSKLKGLVTRAVTQMVRIPCCPYCKIPGFQTTYSEWESNIREYEKTSPGYSAKVAAMKERCGKVMTRFLPDDET